MTALMPDSLRYRRQMKGISSKRIRSRILLPRERPLTMRKYLQRKGMQTFLLKLQKTQ